MEFLKSLLPYLHAAVLVAASAFVQTLQDDPGFAHHFGSGALVVTAVLTVLAQQLSKAEAGK